MQRKLRTLLILSVIMLSSGMFFASLSLSGTLVKIQMENWRQSYGYADIIIHRTEGSPSPFFHLNGALQYRKDMDYIIGEISGFGTYVRPDGGKTGVLLKGMDFDQLQRLTPLVVAEQRGFYPFGGMKAVISTRTAEKYGLKTGDSMKFEINGTMQKFLISAIVRPSGPFTGETETICAVVPGSTLSALYNARGKVDMIYVKLLNPEKKQRYLYLLSQEYKRYRVEEPFTEWEIKKETDRTAAPVIIVTVILSFMCIYIIHTTYKIIILERMPVIGVFRSIGGSRLSTNFLLLLESLFYGFGGGLSGCVFGTGLLYAITAFTGMKGAIQLAPMLDFKIINFLYTIAAALVLAATGSLLPILQAMKLPIKDIILGTFKEKNASSGSGLFLGAALLAISLTLPFCRALKQALAVSTLCMPALLLAVNLLVPHMLNSALKLADRCNIPWVSFQLAVKNLRWNRNARNNISLLIIGLSSFYMISTVNMSQMLEIQNRFGRILSDMTMHMEKTDKAALALISSLPGIKDTLGCFYSERIEVEGKEEPIWHLISVNEKFPAFFKIKSPQGSDVLKTLNTGRNLLLTEALGQRLGVSPGDILVLKLPAVRGSHSYRKYCVTGFFDTIHPGQWSYALISEKNFKEDLPSSFFGQVYIQAQSSPEAVQNLLKTEFAGRKPQIELTKDLKVTAVEANQQLFMILEGYTLLTMITGLYGILNNSVISFLQRKRQLAVYRSVGMSGLQINGMLLTEAVVQGLFGGLLGIAAGVAATWIIVPQILKALSIESALYLSPTPVLHCLAAAAISLLPAVIEPVRQTFKMDLVKAIKCEQE